MRCVPLFAIHLSLNSFSWVRVRVHAISSSKRLLCEPQKLRSFVTMTHTEHWMNDLLKIRILFAGGIFHAMRHCVWMWSSGGDFLLKLIVHSFEMAFTMFFSLYENRMSTSSLGSTPYVEYALCYCITYYAMPHILLSFSKLNELRDCTELLQLIDALSNKYVFAAALLIKWAFIHSFSAHQYQRANFVSKFNRSSCIQEKSRTKPRHMAQHILD